MTAQKSFAGSVKADPSDAKSPIQSKLGGMLAKGFKGLDKSGLSDLSDTRTEQERADDRERLRKNLLASRADASSTISTEPATDLTNQAGKFVQSYIPVGKKRQKAQQDDDHDVDAGMERYLKLQDLLYGGQDTIREISGGIRKDQVAIANSLNKDMLLGRIYSKVKVNNEQVMKRLDGRNEKNLP